MMCTHRLRTPVLYRGCGDVSAQVQNVLQTANSLNNALLTRGDSELSDSLYQALVTALVGSDPLVYGAVIVFDPVHAADSTTRARRAPYVFRNSTTNKLQVCLQAHSQLDCSEKLITVHGLTSVLDQLL